MIALMGSGELTATMVEVHKELLRRLPPPPQAFFLDTPAGFELNCDHISQRAIDYFRQHVQHPMSLASYKAKETAESYEAMHTFQELREANFVLIGPGSPTYAVRQWRYKVGEDLHWVDGMDILGPFGFNLVVIPHWNNAEGGTHDTRFCYMGEARLRQLESLLPGDVSIFGLDEHTACLLDFEKDEAVIRGIGSVTLRRGGRERVFEKTERIPLQILREGKVEAKLSHAVPSISPKPIDKANKDSFWDRVHAAEAKFYSSLKQHEIKQTTHALLELDRMIWQAQQDRESPEFISQARDTLRELIVSIGVKLEVTPRSRTECLAPLIELLLNLRQEFRTQKQFDAADGIRQTIEKAGIIIEDTRQGVRWRLK
jgi:hypothetical protein